MTAFGKAIKFSKKFGIDECEIVFVKKKTTTIRITETTNRNNCYRSEW